jgi:hypothetical protein
VATQWLDKSHPQTLQSAVVLAYLNAGFALFFFLLEASRTPSSLLLIFLGLACYGVANEKRMAYRAAVVIAGLYLLSALALFFYYFQFGTILMLLLGGVMFALLIHPQSREYERIWFK